MFPPQQSTPSRELQWPQVSRLLRENDPLFDVGVAQDQDAVAAAAAGGSSAAASAATPQKPAATASSASPSTPSRTSRPVESSQRAAARQAAIDELREVMAAPKDRVAAAAAAESGQALDDEDDTPSEVVMSVALDEEGSRSGEVIVKAGDDPYSLAADFCAKHALGEELLDPLVQEVRNTLLVVAELEVKRLTLQRDTARARAKRLQVSAGSTCLCVCVSLASMACLLAHLTVGDKQWRTLVPAFRALSNHVVWPAPR